MVVAVDPGTKNIGIAFGDTFLTVTKSTYGKKGVIDLVYRALPYLKKATTIIFEDYAHSNSFNKEEGEVMGMFYALLKGKEIVLMPIKTARKQVVGSGNAKEGEILAKVRELGYAVETPHEADALLLLLAYEKVDTKKWTFSL